MAKEIMFEPVLAAKLKDTEIIAVALCDSDTGRVTAGDPQWAVWLNKILQNELDRLPYNPTSQDARRITDKILKTQGEMFHMVLKAVGSEFINYTLQRPLDAPPIDLNETQNHTLTKCFINEAFKALHQGYWSHPKIRKTQH